MKLNFEELGLPPRVRVAEISYLIAAKAIVVRVHHQDTGGDWLYWRSIEGEPRYRLLLPQEPQHTILSYVPDPTGSRLYVLKFSSTPTVDGKGMGMDFETLYEMEVRDGAQPVELASRATMGRDWIAAILAAGSDPPALYCSVGRHEAPRPGGASMAYGVERFDLSTRRFSPVCDLPGTFI
jgi:hypothetical protein